jgi:hypothetical protein
MVFHGGELRNYWEIEQPPVEYYANELLLHWFQSIILHVWNLPMKESEIRKPRKICRGSPKASPQDRNKSVDVLESKRYLFSHHTTGNYWF